MNTHMFKRDLEEYEQAYLSQPYEKHQAKYRREVVLRNIIKYDHQNILEVGCGLRSIVNDLNSFQSLTVVEPIPFFYEKVKEEAKLIEHKSIEIHQLLMEDYSAVSSSCFNFILIGCLLHEIADLEQFLESVKRCCNRETVVHFSVPNAHSFHRILALKLGLINSVFEKSESNIKFQQFHSFDLNSLKNELMKNDFKVIEDGSYCFKPFTHFQMQQLIDQNIFSESSIQALASMDEYIPDMGSEIYCNVRLK